MAGEQSEGGGERRHQEPTGGPGKTKRYDKRVYLYKKFLFVLYDVKERATETTKYTEWPLR